MRVSGLSSENMEENYSDMNSEFEYTVELNEEVEPEIVNSMAVKQMLQGKAKEVDIDEAAVTENEDANSGKSEIVQNADYVYVLEPDSSIDLSSGNQKSKSKGNQNNTENKNNLNNTKAVGNVSSSETAAVIDLSSSNKRKRKSNLDSTLSHILKTKSVSVSKEDNEAVQEPHAEDVRANKVHIVERDGIAKVKSNTTNELQDILLNGHSETLEKRLVKDLSVKTTQNSPSVGTLKASTPLVNTPKTGSSRKNRRKCSVPVRCDKNEEINDMNDIMEEYGVQTDRSISATVKDMAEKPTDGPIDLTPKVKQNAQSLLETSIAMAPIDLTASSKVEESGQTKLNDNQPVDLSKPAASTHSNGFKTAGENIPGIQPNAVPFDPIQMRQLFETMYKMQAQFPNQNLVQAQLMQFHALMQNAMLNGSTVPMGNLNGVKNGKETKNDKNDNIIQAEPVVSNGQTSYEIQKLSLELMHKNGLIQNNFPPQFNNVAPVSPFNTDQANQFKSRSVKKKNRAPSVMNESSLDSIKLEGSTPLVDLDGRHGPEQVVETLQQYFPIMPAESLPQTQLHNDSNSVRFFVKDNEQIRVIVDSLLQVGVLDLDERKIHGTEPVFKYICRVCNQTFFHVEHLTKHVKKYHVVKKYQCSECDRSFHDAGNYRQHMRVHDETDIPYECPECKRRFRHKCTLKVHMRIHTGEKPFKCEICSATFKISSGLQTHMRKHTGETPYACEFCDLRFKCQSNLKQHLFQHTQVRPFPCDICGKTYSRKSIRDAHLLTHTKETGKNEHVKKWIDDLPQQPLAVGGSE